MSCLLVLVVREFGGPNSFLVGENLMSPYPYFVSFACFHARESEFCGLSMHFLMDFGKNLQLFDVANGVSQGGYVSNC